MPPDYTLRPVRRYDLPLLTSWRSRPHVARWWGPPGVEDEEGKLSDRRVAMWLAELRSQPFAFVQDYRVNDWLPHHFDFLPPGSRGIDIYVGEASMLGVGHGSRVLSQHVERLFEGGVPAVGIDPHPENRTAIRAFEKAGFDVVGGPTETRWGRAILMACHAPPRPLAGKAERVTRTRDPAVPTPEPACRDMVGQGEPWAGTG